MSNRYGIETVELQRVATIAVESYIRALEDEGMLTESADYILANYSIVTYQKGFWGSLVEKIFGIDKEKTGDNIYFRTVKQIYHKKQKQGDPPSPQRNFRLVELKKDDG